MKDLSSRWAAAILLVPALLILLLAFMGDSDRASAAKAPANKGIVAVAFVGSIGDAAATFQRITLNVVSIRLNPKPDTSISDFDPGWVTISVPAGVGKSFGIGEVNTGSNFGGSFSNSNNNVVLGEGRSEIQIDLGAIQNVAQIFNAQAIAAKTYQQVELVLDTVTPGDIVPLCAGAIAGEGCIDYKAKFPQVTPTPAIPLTIRAVIPGGGIVLPKSQHVVTPLVIQIDPGIGAPPTVSNQTIQINPSISVIPNSTSTPISGMTVFLNPSLGTIVGTITTTANSGFASGRPQSITALNAGTNTIVETQTLPNSCYGKKTCDFIMQLPAAPAITDSSAPGYPGGTNYDLVASAKAASYAVRSNVNVVANTLTDLRTDPVSGLATPFAVVSKSTISFSGKVFDICNAAGVPAATLNLLVPDTRFASTPDCSANPPTGCVVAATASSNEVGNFPLPGNGNQKAPFDLVPVPDVSTPYELVITAGGFDRTPVQVTNNSGALKCANSIKKGTCQINLNHGIMTGTVSLGGGGTGPLSVLIAAEDSATNNIENLQLVNIPAGVTSVPYTINVPDTDDVLYGGAKLSNLDFFSSTQDLFNGAPQAATGHSIAVFANANAPTPVPSGAPSPVCTLTAGPDLNPMTCVGHGSVTGTVTNPATTDTVVLSKTSNQGGLDVQLASVPVVPNGSAGAGTYSICAPADSYVVTHYQVPPQPTPDTATPTPTPTPIVVPTPQAVASFSVTLNPPLIVPTPAPSPGFTPTPCPNICNVPGSSGACVICQGTSASF